MLLSQGQAWTTCFFDTNVVGTANALVGGWVPQYLPNSKDFLLIVYHNLRWGNAGGGTTFIIMTVLYQGLTSAGLSSQSAWRSAFAIVPVPALIIVAILIMSFGTDHPAGTWEDRHRPLAAAGVDEADPEMEKRYFRPSMHANQLVGNGKSTLVPTEDSRGVFLGISLKFHILLSYI